MSPDPPAAKAATRHGAPVVVAERVTRRYGDVDAIDNTSIAIGVGEIVGICGPSGVGKSTLLRLLGGLERPDRGEIRYADQPAWPNGARHAQLPRPGYVMPVFQDPTASLDPRWPIWRTLTEPLTARWRAQRPRRDERRDIARRWLARAHLQHLDLDVRPGELSGGQCQRIAVLRALIAGPALLIADEPTARQDVITSAAIAELLRAAAEHGIGLAVVSHDQRWLAPLAHRTLELP